MPRGRLPEGSAALSNAERQARHRARKRARQRPLTIKRPQAARRSRGRRWNDALAEMIAVQLECAAWFEALPESLARDHSMSDAPTAEATAAFVAVSPLHRHSFAKRCPVFTAVAAQDNVQWP